MRILTSLVELVRTRRNEGKLTGQDSTTFYNSVKIINLIFIQNYALFANVVDVWLLCDCCLLSCSPYIRSFKALFGLTANFRNIIC
jgi:hypothetical protein